MGAFLRELRRRNVFRVAAAYAIVAWVIVQAAALLQSGLGLPSWFNATIIVLLALGFPVALVLAWAFELTPEGVKPTEPIADGAQVRPLHGTDYALIGLLALLVVVSLVQTLRGSGSSGAPPTEQSAAGEESGDRAGESPGLKTIAVLPFTNMSAEADQEFFSDGISEELLNVLAKVSGLRVTSRTSAFVFKGAEKPIPEIAAQLGVQYVLEGSVRRTAGRVRVTAQLIDVKTDSHLWSHAYDREVDDIFAVQDEIAAQVTEALKVTLLGADDRPVERLPTTSIDLYADFLKARQQMATFKFESMKEAETSLKRIVAEDPKFVPAATTLINLYYRMAETGILSAAEARDKAKPLVDGVLAENERSAEAWLARAEILSFDGKADEAEAARGRAHALEPNNPIILRSQILQDTWARKPGVAAPLIDRLIAADPLSMLSYIPALYWHSRRDDAAQLRAIKRRLVALSKDNPVSPFVPFMMPLPEDDNASVVAEGKRGYLLEPTDPDVPAFLALHLLGAGEEKEAERYIREARALSSEHAFAAVVDALGRVYRGDDSGGVKIAVKLARADSPSRWGSREIALRMLTTRALARNDAPALRKLAATYVVVYPGLERADLTSRITDAAFYVKWAHLTAALDLAAIRAKLGEAEKANTLLDAVGSELPLWPRRSMFGIGYADAELQAIRGDDRAALASLRKAAREGQTAAWWWFLDKSPHFARLREDPAFAEVRADFAARAAVPKTMDGEPQ